mgnify:CR=1 FL=1
MPNVGGTEFPYTQAGIQKAKAWAEMTGKPMQMQKSGYDTGGQIDPSSLEEVAHRPIEGNTRQAVRHKALTKGGEQRHLTADIEGLVNEEMKRELYTAWLREQIKNRPDFPDTVSAEEAKEFMERKSTSILDLLKKLIPEFKEGGQIPVKYGLGGWLKKQKEKSKKWWNKNIKPAGKQNLWEGIGTVAHALDPTGISGLATCLGQGKNYWDCVKYRGERDPFGKIKDKAAFPSPGQIMQNPNWASGVPGDIPLHTGVDVTEWGIDDPTDITQWGDLTDEQREYMEWAYGDDTAFVDSPPLPEEPSIEMPARKSPKFWGFEKFGKGKKGDLQKLVDEMLAGRKGKQAAYGGKIPKYNIGGPVSTPMMNPSRRLYGQRPPVQQPVAQRRRRPRPVMQTSTRGMPVRGGGMDMQMGQPMYKKGGSVIPKGWHV